jgi:glutamyl-tRNA reductase
MKFLTSILLCIVAIAPVTAFVAPLPSVARTSTVSPSQQLSMIATGEMINGETKKKTREVRVDLCLKKVENRLSFFLPFRRPPQERLEAATKGLQVHVVGLSIHHAEVEVREKLAISEAEWNAASNEICASGKVNEAAVLSTCNRFEVYYAATDARAAMAHVTQYLSERSGIPVSSLRRNLFMLSGDDAVWHIMRVAGGLDSLIVGEGQILSQVRQCHLHSIEEDGCGGKVLSRLLNNAVAAGKRVRSETAISKGSVSISSAAVELSEMLSMKDLKLPFSECRLAAVGAGKMTRLLITHLASRGLEKITIVNRSLDRPKELQEQFPDIDIEIKLMDDLWDVVGRSDIVYTATSCVDYVIDEQKLDVNGLVGGRPLMLVDISVPRNVNENCNEVRKFDVQVIFE